MLLGNIRLWFSYFRTFFFSTISPDNLESPKISVVPFFFIYFTVKCYCLRYWYFLLEQFEFPFLCYLIHRNVLQFNCMAVFSFWPEGRLSFGSFINYNIKIYTRWFTWKTLEGFITNRCIKFAKYWRGIFYFIKFAFILTVLEWCGVGWKFCFLCWCS